MFPQWRAIDNHSSSDQELSMVSVASVQGCIFAVVGMAAGIVGTAASNGLIAVRKALDPKFVPQNELPNIPLNAAAWATHMGVSSNLRYQLLNGFEMVLSCTFEPPLRAFAALINLVMRSLR